MTTTTASQPPVPNAPERPRRKRHWLRRAIAGTDIFVVRVGLVAAAIKLQPTPEPLAVPANASAPAAFWTRDRRLPSDGNREGAHE